MNLTNEQKRKVINEGSSFTAYIAGLQSEVDAEDASMGMVNAVNEFGGCLPICNYKSAFTDCITELSEAAWLNDGEPQ